MPTLRTRGTFGELNFPGIPSRLPANQRLPLNAAQILACLPEEEEKEIFKQPIIEVPKVLLIASDATERAQLEKTLAPHAELTSVSDWPEAARNLAQAGYGTVFCACTLSDGSWRNVLEEVRRINSILPVIVLSETASAPEFSEVLEAGAFDLLGIPYDERLVPAMTQALASHEARVRYGKTERQMR